MRRETLRDRVRLRKRLELAVSVSVTAPWRFSWRMPFPGDRLGCDWSRNGRSVCRAAARARAPSRPTSADLVSLATRRPVVLAGPFLLRTKPAAHHCRPCFVGIAFVIARGPRGWLLSYLRPVPLHESEPTSSWPIPYRLDMNCSRCAHLLRPRRLQDRCINCVPPYTPAPALLPSGRGVSRTL